MIFFILLHVQLTCTYIPSSWLGFIWWKERAQKLATRRMVSRVKVGCAVSFRFIMT